MEDRVHAAWVGGIVKGGFHFISLHLVDGQGMSETNQAILTEVAAYIGTLQGPWLVAGDWNLTPEVLRQSGWAKSLRALS